MADAPVVPTLGEVLVDELKRQAREEGYIVWTLNRYEAYLYVMYAVGILVGWTLARRP
ncbi:MAG: hypothetical protein HOY76_18580 [Streptomyces sp.]|nr:hypothetical protein [Streptomyces sp.]